MAIYIYPALRQCHNITWSLEMRLCEVQLSLISRDLNKHNAKALQTDGRIQHLVETNFYENPFLNTGIELSKTK